MGHTEWGAVLVSGGLLMAIIGFFVGNTKGNGCGVAAWGSCGTARDHHRDPDAEAQWIGEW